MKTKYLSPPILILIAILGMQITVTQAQEDYQKQMDNIFDISSSKIPSGILINRSPELLDMKGYRPANKEQVDTCNLYQWMCLYYRIYASHLKLQDFRYEKTIARQYFTKVKLKSGEIPLGILFYDYDQLKASAVEDRLLMVDTLKMRVHDLTGDKGTLTEAVSCFAFSPMADTIFTGDYSFRIDPSLFVSNKTKELDELYIDFDDKRGYVKVSIGETVKVSYVSAGDKTLKIKAVFEKEPLTAYAGLYVINNNNSMLRSANSNDMPAPNVGPALYRDNGIDAKYGIWYRCNHNNTIHKPILIVSGFDPSDQMRICFEPGVANDDKRVSLYSVANKNRFLDKLREMGYDIIIYRSTNSTQSIIPNAMNLVNFITNKINAVKTSDNELIVIGASMGGLVCRYALTYMEQSNNTYDHKTKLFISVDSPQNGANIPLGFQFMAKYINQDFAGNIEMLRKAMDDMLDSDAAKQMLIYHHLNTSGLTARCATERTDFLNSLAAIGNFPQRCRTMAISMGSGNGTNQGFAAGASLIKKQPSPFVTGTYLTLDILLALLGIPLPVGATLNSTSWKFDVHAVPNQTKAEIYSEEISLNICVPKTVIIWTPLPVPVLVLDCSPNIINRKIEVNNTQPLDNAPGSIRGLHNLSDFNFEDVTPFLSILGIAWFDSHFDCFIPSYSALGLNIAPHSNIKSYLNTSSGVTKINDNFYVNTNKTVSLFDYLYIENINNDHIFDSNKVGVFSPAMLFAMEGLANPAQLTLSDKTINSGQSVAYEAAEKITVNGNFIVQSGGNLSMRSEQIILKPGFHAKAGSTAKLKADISWICPAGSIQSVSLYPLSNLDFNQDTEIEEFHKEPISQPLVKPIENEVRLFPNPVENLLNIRVLNEIEGEIRITIINEMGQIVYSQLITSDIDNTVDCSRLSSGIYFVHIAMKDRTQTVKIIKK